MRIIILTACVITFISFACVPTTDQEVDLLTPEEQQWLSEHEGKILYAPNPNYPPIAFVDEDGTFKGITADYIKLIEQKLDFRFERVYYDTWNEMVESAQQGKVDLIGAIQNTPERREFLRFTMPYVTIPNSIVVRENLEGTLTPDIMAGMKVVIVEGYSSYDYIESTYPDIMLEPVRDNPAGLQMVSFGRADAMITDLAVASYFIEKLGIVNLRVAGSIDYTWELCFGLKKDWPVLQSILQKVLDDISPEEKEAIYRKWVSVPGVDIWKEVIVPILIGLGVVILIVGSVSILIWNGSLNRKIQQRTAELTKELTERKHAEEALQESETRYRDLYEEAPNAYVSVGANGKIERANRSAVELFGYSREELIGRPVFDLYTDTPDGKAKAQDIFQRFLDGEEIRDEELEMRRADGSKVWASISVRPIHDEGGKVIASRSEIVDITERKKLDQLKDDFIGLVSHELRSPMTVITGAINTALTEGVRLSPEETRQLLEDAASEANVLSHLLGNLLELSRIQASRLHLYAEEISVRKVIHDAVDEIKRQSLAHQFIIDVPAGLPLVYADELRMERILYNLLENAVKYSPQGGEIRVFVKPKDKHLVIGVSDKGIGISQSDQAKLFEPFQRLEDSRPDSARGVGLGLLVCRRLVEAHGGQIWVESEPGRGTTFFFTIPLSNNLPRD